MEFLSISDALTSDGQSVSVIGHVLDVGTLETYQNKTGDDRSYFLVKVADKDNFTSVRIYHKQMLKMITIGATYAFMNLVKKTDSTTPFWAITSSQIVAWAPIIVPDDVKRRSMETETKGPNSPRKLKDALSSMTTSTVQGKIVQSSPVKYVRDGNLAIKHLALKDEETAPAVAISLFGKAAEQTYSVGDVISITDVYKYKKSESLSTKPTSSVEFHPAELVPFSVCDTDMLDNEMFQAQQDDTVSFQILGIKYAYVYASCIKFACKNKKLKEGRCPNCGSTDSSLYCNSRVIVSQTGKFTEHSVFYSEMKRLVDLPALSSFDENNSLLDFLTSKLPIQGRGVFCGEKMTVSSIKRKRDD